MFRNGNGTNQEDKVVGSLDGTKGSKHTLQETPKCPHNWSGVVARVSWTNQPDRLHQTTGRHRSPFFLADKRTDTARELTA